MEAAKAELQAWESECGIEWAITSAEDGKITLVLSGALEGDLSVSVPSRYASQGSTGCVVFSSETEDLEDAVTALNAAVDGGVKSLSELLPLLDAGVKDGFDDLIPDLSDEEYSGSSDDELVMEGDSDEEEGENVFVFVLSYFRTHHFLAKSRYRR